MPEADTSIQVTPGTTATVAVERIGAKLYQAIVMADAYGQIIGARNTYVVSDRRTVGAANARYLTLYNDTTATFVEVMRATISTSTTAAVTGLPRLIYLSRISIKSGGTLATPVALNTASPSFPIPRIKAYRMATGSTAIGTPLALSAYNPEETGPSQTIEIYNAYNEEPILLRGQQGIMIQQDGTAILGLVSACICFRVRP